jgi:DnaK suppressor protein
MTKKQIEHYKKLLSEEKAAILHDILEDEDEVRDLVENDQHTVNDSVDSASSSITQNLLAIMSSKNKQKIAGIDAALRRIDEGSYGKCVACGVDIKSKRLESLPWATLCIDCKRSTEKRKIS